MNRLALASHAALSVSGSFAIAAESAPGGIAGTSGDTLVNAGVTIRGAATIGAGEISVINQAGGVIEASGTHKLVLSVPANIFPGQPLFELINAAALEALAGSRARPRPHHPERRRHHRSRRRCGGRGVRWGRLRRQAQQQWRRPYPHSR